MRPEHKPALQARVWQSEASFLDSQAPWNALCARIPGASVFLRHEWFDAAWRWCRTEATLYIVVLYDGDRLVGAAPMVLRQAATRPRHRRLTFLTVPDTQSCDLLAEPELRPAVIDALMTTLEQRRDWDVLELAYLNPEAAQEIAAYAQRKGRSVTLRDQGTNPGMELTGTWQEYYARRSRRLKKGNNLIANKLTKGGHDVQLERCSGDPTGQETMQLVEDAVAVSARSWKRQTGLSLDFPGPNAFIRRLSELAARNGWLSIWRLRVDGRTLAMEYQLSFGGRIHALRSDFDDSASELSPGTYLNWKMLEQLFETGNRQYLMGPGENAYKLRWAEAFDPVKRVVIYGNTARGRLQSLLDLRLRPALRWARNQWRARTPSNKENA